MRTSSPPQAAAGDAKARGVISAVLTTETVTFKKVTRITSVLRKNHYKAIDKTATLAPYIITLFNDKNKMRQLY